MKNSFPRIALFCSALALVLTSMLVSGTAQAAHQLPQDNTNVPDAPKWVEAPTTSAPEFSMAHLLAIDMPPHLSLKISIDPDTLMVGGDGVVRYVVVMTGSSGVSNAFYEGIRCETREVKTYARRSSSGDWTMTTAPVWRGLEDNMPSHHAQAMASQGVCTASTAGTREEILRALDKGRTSPREIRTN